MLWVTSKYERLTPTPCEVCVGMRVDPLHVLSMLILWFYFNNCDVSCFRKSGIEVRLAHEVREEVHANLIKQVGW